MQIIRLIFRVLAELARKHLPQLSKHIDKLQVPWALLSSKWFICLFVDVLPVETVLRIWDCLFSEGSKVRLFFNLKMFRLTLNVVLNTYYFCDLNLNFIFRC